MKITANPAAVRALAAAIVAQVSSNIQRDPPVKGETRDAIACEGNKCPFRLEITPAYFNCDVTPKGWLRIRGGEACIALTKEGIEQGLTKILPRIYTQHQASREAWKGVIQGIDRPATDFERLLDWARTLKEARKAGHFRRFVLIEREPEQTVKRDIYSE